MCLNSKKNFLYFWMNSEKKKVEGESVYENFCCGKLGEKKFLNNYENSCFIYDMYLGY